MRMRERGKIWPVVSIAAAAFFVLVIMPLILHRQKSGEMATVDAQVTIGDGSGDSAIEPNALKYRWPDSEVPRTAERLRDATAVAIAASANVVEGGMRNHAPRNVTAIISDVASRQLVPSEWVTRQPGVLKMPQGTVHVRYAPADFVIEVVSVPNDRNDGPALLIRIPDTENPSVGIRYFESMQLDGIIYPPPFAPIAQIIASGWQPKPFKQTQIPDEQRAQLEQWAHIAIKQER
jgi:hypothetical protein